MKRRCLSLLVLMSAVVSLMGLETLHWDFSKERSAVVGGVAYVPQEGMRGNRVLAVVDHVGKAHANQTFTVTFDWDALGISVPPTKVAERMTEEEPGDQELWQRRKEFSVPPERAPLRWGDLVVKVHSFQGNTLRMSLNYHSFALLKLQQPPPPHPSCHA